MTAQAAVLWRAFVAQFFASESASSDVQLRRTIIWIAAFLLTPCLFLTAIVLPTFEIVRLVAAHRHAPEMIERMLAQLSAIYVSYSMVTIGLVTVFLWDRLNFDQRDAMVIGPLPMKGVIVIAAKFAALVAVLLGLSLAINIICGLPYAFVTGANDGILKSLRHFLGYFAGTVGGAIFVFSTIVTIHGLCLLLAGPRIAESVGPVLQFLFVSLILCFFLVPTAMGSMQPVFLAATISDWMPTKWYFGLFEQLRGSSAKHALETSRALFALAASVSCALFATIVGFRRQMQAALAPTRAVAFLPWFELRRRVGQWLVGRDVVARGALDFILLSLSRSRQHQSYIGMSAAVAVAIANVALARRATSFEALMQPSSVVLWVPLLFGYWTAIGLRASFFAPTELPAAWAFQVNGRHSSSAYWSATRAAMIAIVVLPAIVLDVIIVAPLAGWRLAVVYLPMVAAVLTLLVEILALTIDFVPFTRAYRPGHARLKTRWPLYLVGMLLTAYVPARNTLWLVNRPSVLLATITVICAAIVAVDLKSRTASKKWSSTPVELDDDDDAATVLRL